MQNLLFFMLLLGGALSSTPVRKCKDVKQELFKEVTVSTSKGVCTKFPCEFIQGEDAKAAITFDVRSLVKQITVKCNATVMGATVDYPLPNASKGCDLLTNTYCPVEPDTEAELLLKVHISYIFPKVPVDLVFYLLDQNQKMISCFEVSAKVVSKKLFLAHEN